MLQALASSTMTGARVKGMAFSAMTASTIASMDAILSAKGTVGVGLVTTGLEGCWLSGWIMVGGADSVLKIENNPALFLVSVLCTKLPRL